MKFLKLFESFTQDEFIEKANDIFKVFYIRKLNIDYSPEKCIEDYKKTGNWDKVKIAILLKKYLSEYWSEGGKKTSFEKLKDFNLKKTSSELYKFNWWTELFLKWNQDSEVLGEFIKTYEFWYSYGTWEHIRAHARWSEHRLRKRLINSMKLFSKYRRKKIRFPLNI